MGKSTIRCVNIAPISLNRGRSSADTFVDPSIFMLPMSSNRS